MARGALSRLGEFRQTVEKVVSMLAERGLTVTQMGTSAYVNYGPNGLPKTVNIPMIPDSADDAFIAAIRGFIDHEVAHILFSDGNQLVQAAKRQNRHQKTVTNIVEDVRIERAIQERFPGSAEHIKDTWEWIYRTKMDKAVRDARSDEELFGTLLPTVIHAFGGKPASQAYLDNNKLWDRLKPLTDRLAPLRARLAGSIKDTAAAIALSEEVYQAIKTPPPPPPPPPPPIPSPPPPEPPEEPQESDEESDEGEAPEEPQEQEDDQEGEAGEAESEDDAESEAEEDAPSEPEEEQENEAEDEADDAGAEEETQPEDEEGAAEEADAEGEDTQDESEEVEEEQGSEDAGGGSDQDEIEEEISEGESEGNGAGDDEGDEEIEEEVEGQGAGVDDSTSEDEVDGSEEADEEEQDGGQIDSFSPEDMLNGVEDFEDLISDALRGAAQHGVSDEEYLPFTLDMDQWVTADPKPGTEDRVQAELERMEAKVGKMVGQLAAQFRRLFAQKEVSVMVGGLRSGRIHAPALHRLHVGDDRVFARREEHNAQDTAVTLLIDCSGSMEDGNKIHLAMLSAYAFSQTLDRVGIVHEVLGFTTRDDLYAILTQQMREEMAESQKALGRVFSRFDAIRMIVFKTFDEPFRRSRLRFATMQQGISDDEGEDYRPYPCYSNIDGESLLYAGDRLLQRREQRKVMIVFSDGMPAGGGIGPHLFQHLKDTVKKLEARKVETLGIGIMSTDVRAFYGKHAIVHRVDDLPTVVMKEISRILLKG